MCDFFFYYYFYSCFSAAFKFVFDSFFLKLVYMPFLFYKQLSGIGRHYILDSRYELCHQFHHLIFCCCVQVWQSGGIIRIHQWSLPCRHCRFRLHWSSGEVIWAPRSQYRKIAGKDMCVCLSVLPYIWCGVCLFAFSSVHATSIFFCVVLFFAPVLLLIICWTKRLLFIV